MTTDPILENFTPKIQELLALHFAIFLNFPRSLHRKQLKETCTIFNISQFQTTNTIAIPTQFPTIILPTKN